jgi:hypothetical protein
VRWRIQAAAADLADNLRKKAGGQVEIINMIVPLVNYITTAVPTVPAR